MFQQVHRFLTGMSPTVADTSFLVDLMRRDKGAIRLFEQFEDSAVSLNTTGITALEFYKGAK